MCQQRTDILQVSTLIVQFIEDRTGLAFRVKLKKFPQFFMFNREIKKREITFKSFTNDRYETCINMMQL